MVEAAGISLEIIFLFYGLAFVLLGMSILLLPKEGISSGLLSTLWLLAAFGITHGIREWVALYALKAPDRPATAMTESFLLIVSYVFLFEFGRRLIRTRGPGSGMRAWLVRAIGPGVYVALAVGLLVGAAWGGMLGLSAAGRCFLGFPGSLLTAIGLLMCAEAEGKTVESARLLPRFRAAALAFLVYGVVGGLVLQRGAKFPVAIVNEDTFAAAVGIPVQVFRAACAVLILVTLSAILRAYHVEFRRRLRTSLENAQASLVEVGRLGERNRLILESAGAGIYGLDCDGNTTFVNRLAAEMIGWRPEELIGQPHHALVHHTRADGTSWPREECVIEAAIREGRVQRGDRELFWRKDGSSFEVDFTSTPVREKGEIVGAVVTFRDVTEIRQAQHHLRQSALVLQHMPEGVVITDARGRIQTVNPAFENSTGYCRGEVLGHTARMLRSTHHDDSFYRRIMTSLRDGGRWQGEIWIRRKDGEIHPEWLSINALRDGRDTITNYIAVFSDVETNKEVKQRLHRLAYYDGLTNLPNRQLFQDRLGLTLAQARRGGSNVALMFIDLDRFKQVNDTLGHSMGDRILQSVAERIREAVRESDTIARIGGDEFTLILPDLVDPIDAAKVARKILEILERPFTLAGREFFISASIGISIYPDDGQDRESLTRKADIAMYRAKDLGRNNYQLYTEQMSDHMHDRVALENDLQRALEREEIYVLYQPQIELCSKRLVGVEALARWRHPRLGNVPPSTFISIAEDTGLINRIGEWVLRRACRDAGSWTSGGPQGLRVAVNVSARQLRRREFVDRVARILEQTSMMPQSLALELTESVMAEPSSGQDATLQALSDMGVQITIDDFGTGYSSLSYLKRFAIDKLKIDQSFVRDIPGDPHDCVLASMIIALAHASSMRVTAEGVETTAQLEFLQHQGCDEVQGFLFSEPVTGAAISRMCERSEGIDASSAGRA